MMARFAWAAALGVMLGGTLQPARGDEMPMARPDVQEAGGGSTSAPAVPVSVLQVSGNTNSFVISAQHADVLSLLKLVFNQAHRQFVPDASVTGDVTFALNGQRLETVLESICKQAFLRYDIDQHNIYQFHRDDAALRNFLVKTQMINSVLLEQMRRMGYATPGATANSLALSAGGQSALGMNAPASRSFGQGGFGGGGSGGSIVGQGYSQPMGRAKSANTPDEMRTDAPNLADAAQYQLFLKQNNFVTFNTQEQDRPVRDVLADLSAQSGVTIFVDPAVPSGASFVVNGYITPRPLSEVLNYLAYRARLEWHWINNRIFITITPQLNLLLRGQPLPFQGQGQGGGQNSPQNARSQFNAGQQRSAAGQQNAPVLQSAKPLAPKPLEQSKQDQSKPLAPADKPKTKDQND